MTGTKAYAKLNLALVVGPRRSEGKHEVVSVLQAIDLHDDVLIAPAAELAVEGFPADTLVRDALQALADAAGVAPAWRARIDKRIPAAAGLGGGSADAAAALRLANATLAEPLPEHDLHRIAAALGTDVPFFLRRGPQLATGDGTELASLELPADYTVLVVLPVGATKVSTASVYRAFDERRGAEGFHERRRALLDALERIEATRELTALPANDLASSPVADELRRRGAVRADVTGAGPAVYGLFEDAAAAERAATSLADIGETWLTRPVGPESAREDGKMGPLWGVAKW